MLTNISNTIHKEILTETQQSLLHIVKNFCSSPFYLAGGTALALQLGHRQSIDFDLFSNKHINSKKILQKIVKLGISTKDIEVIVDNKDEYTIFIKGVKFTFLYYPFPITDLVTIDGISMASPLSIAAMKSYALGRRGKWKDYVDLFVIFQKYTYTEVIQVSKDIFDTLFSEKMFLQQLCYFNDVDRLEEVIWEKLKYSDREIEAYLTKLAVQKR